MKAVSYTGFEGWADGHAATALLVTTVLAVPVALLLAWPPVAGRLSVVVDPVGAWRGRHHAHRVVRSR